MEVLILLVGYVSLIYVCEHRMFFADALEPLMPASVVISRRALPLSLKARACSSVIAIAAVCEPLALLAFVLHARITLDGSLAGHLRAGVHIPARIMRGLRRFR